MKALILAAGAGKRLGAASGGLPKCLLEIDGARLIDHQLRMLSDAGFGPVCMVVGHAHEQVRAAVGSRAEFVLNPRYEETNSLYSLSLAAGWLDEAALILNADVLFDPELLRRLQKAGPDVLAYDSGSGDASEQMKVFFDNGRLRRMSKEGTGSTGENVGVLYLSAASVRMLAEHARRLVAEGADKRFLADGIERVASERPIKGVDVADVPWVEIDFAADLERARREVWPAIQKSAGRRRRRRLTWAVTALVGIALGAVVGWALKASVAPEWEEIPLAAESMITLPSTGGPRNWWRVESTETLRLKVSGPERFRVDVRFLMPNTGAATRPYVVETAWDDTVDWRSLTARPSTHVLKSGERVGDKDYLEVEVPPGDHELRVRLVVGEGSGLLVRILRPREPE